MEQKYILGIKGIAEFFGLTASEVSFLVANGGIPGVKKIQRPSLGNFPGGGRGMWVLNRQLAEKYRHTRNQTDKYEPSRVTKELLTYFAETGCKTIPELVDAGYLDDMTWCEALDKERERCNLHVPILMHRDDLNEYLGKKEVVELKRKDILPDTTKIFKPIRRRR